MKTKATLLIALFAMLVISSCYYDNAEELYPTDPCDLTNVTYSGTISPLVDKECNICHSAALNLGNVTLEGYTELKKYIDNGKFLSSIIHDGNASPMPKGGDKLTDCNINLIRTWLDAGAPNN